MPALRLDWADLQGLPEAAAEAAGAAWRRSCGLLGPVWGAFARAAESDGFAGAARALLVPVRFEDGARPLVTGYFEPEIEADFSPSPRFPVPLHAPPPGLVAADPGLTRAAIGAGALDGRGLDLAFVASEVDRFMLQVQGSGRLRLPSGAVLRLGYAGRNGHPYVSLGQSLVADGTFAAGEVTADRLRAHLLAQPDGGRAIMNRNPSYVFFRRIDDLPPDAGPIGSAGVPLTPGISIAADLVVHPHGWPVVLELPGEAARLCIVQDSGSAIRGAQRADLFFGWGRAAGERAGRLAAAGRLTALLPPALLAAGPG